MRSFNYFRSPAYFGTIAELLKPRAGGETEKQWRRVIVENRLWSRSFIGAALNTRPPLALQKTNLSH